jgi:hypothetical protein
LRTKSERHVRSALASPLVESPGRAAKQSEEGQGKEKPANPPPTVPGLQLEINFCFGGWRGKMRRRWIGNRCCARGWKRRHDKTTPAQRARHLEFRPRGVRFEFLVTVGAVDTHGADVISKI